MRRAAIVVACAALVAAAAFGAHMLLGIRPCSMTANDCSEGQVCAKGVLPPWSHGFCIDALEPAPGPYVLPLRNPSGVICTQSPRTPNGSHAFKNALFAFDLTSPLDGPAGLVVAARAGTVLLVHAQCSDPGVAQNYSDDCGFGFGNFVVIDHGDGTAAFYAHLATVDVEPGVHVEINSPIGREGITGKTGHRHLHFGVHRVDGTPLTGGMPWLSVPFTLVFSDATGDRQVSAAELVCGHNDFGQARWYSPR